MNREFDRASHALGITQEVIDARKRLAESAFFRCVFPCEYSDPTGGLKDAENYTRNGYGINIVVAPHPALRDSIDVARSILRNEELRKKQISVPGAIHQLESFGVGSLLRFYSRLCSVEMYPIITARSREKYPQRYSELDARDRAHSFIERATHRLKSGGVLVEYLHGDRAGTVDVLPPRGIIALGNAYARRQGVRNAVYLFAYLHNPAVTEPQAYRGFEPFRKYRMVFGRAVPYERAREEAKTVRTIGNLELLDYWAYREIRELADASQNG